MSRTISTRKRLLATTSIAVMTSAVTALALSSSAIAESNTAESPGPLEWETLAEAPPGDPRSLTVIGDDNVWAVGSEAGTALASHWNGSAWTSTEVAGLKYFTDASFSGDSDGWAVGDGAAYWDGSAWASVPTPLPDNTNAWLSAVDTVSPDLAWAVGNTAMQGGGEGTAFIQHWNGTEWTLTEPKFPSEFTAVDLNDVVSVDADEAWAVGTAYRGGVLEPLIMHWDGTQWSIQDSPAPTGNLTSLAVSDGELFASGFSPVENSPVDAGPLLMRLDDADWTVLETPDATGWFYSSIPDGDGGLIAYGYDSESSQVLRWNSGTATYEAGPAGSGSIGVIATATDGGSAIWLLTQGTDGWFVAYAK